MEQCPKARAIGVATDPRLEKVRKLNDNSAAAKHAVLDHLEHVDSHVAPNLATSSFPTSGLVDPFLPDHLYHLSAEVNAHKQSVNVLQQRVTPTNLDDGLIDSVASVGPHIDNLDNLPLVDPGPRPASLLRTAPQFRHEKPQMQGDGPTPQSTAGPGQEPKASVDQETTDDVAIQAFLTELSSGQDHYNWVDDAGRYRVEFTVTMYEGRCSLSINDGGQAGSPNWMFNNPPKSERIISNWRRIDKKWHLSIQRKFDDLVWCATNDPGEPVKKFGYVVLHETFVDKFDNDLNKLLLHFNAFWEPKGFTFFVPLGQIPLLTIEIVIKQHTGVVVLHRNQGYYALLNLQETPLNSQETPTFKLITVGLSKGEYLGELCHVCTHPAATARVIGSALRAHLRLAGKKNFTIKVTDSIPDVATLHMLV